MGFKLNDFDGWTEGMKLRISLQNHSRRARLAVSVLMILSQALVGPHACAQDASASQGKPPHHMFTPGYTGRAMSMDGGLRASVHTFKAEDGTPVYQSDDWYKSASDARTALDRLTKKASNVIKQSTRKDAKGRAIGKRVELVLNHGRKSSPEMVIAWTDGATVVRLSSTSLPLLLDFESQYYP